MAKSNTRPTDRMALVAQTQPGAVAPATVSTPWLDIHLAARFLAIIVVGTIGSGGTVDAKIEQATDDAGAGAKDVEGKAMAQLSQAGDNDSDSQVLIDLATADFDIDGGFGFVRLSVTVAGASAGLSASMLAIDPREMPPEQAASVAEKV